MCLLIKSIFYFYKNSKNWRAYRESINIVKYPLFARASSINHLALSFVSSFKKFFFIFFNLAFRFWIYISIRIAIFSVNC